MLPLIISNNETYSRTCWVMSSPSCAAVRILMEEEEIHYVHTASKGL